MFAKMAMPKNEQKKYEINRLLLLEFSSFYRSLDKPDKEEWSSEQNPYSIDDDY